MPDFQVDDAERGRVRALVVSAVRIRFVLDAEAFVSRLLGLAGRLAGAGAAPSAFLSRFSLDDLYRATACAGQDEDAWAELVTRYRDFIHRFAGSSRRGDRGSVERRKIDGTERRSSLKTWFGTVVSHAAINAAKTAKTLGPREDPAIDPETEIEDK